jgi:hypothetical protein
MTHGYTEDLATGWPAYQDRLEEAAKRGPANLAAAFNDPPPGLACHEIDTEMKVLRANDADLRLLGLHARGVRRQARARLHRDDGDGPARDRKEADGGAGAQAVRPHLPAQGRHAVALVLLDRYLKDASGQVIGCGPCSRRPTAPAEPRNRGEERPWGPTGGRGW